MVSLNGCNTRTHNFCRFCTTSSVGVSCNLLWLVATISSNVKFLLNRISSHSFYRRFRRFLRFLSCLFKKQLLQLEQLFFLPADFFLQQKLSEIIQKFYPEILLLRMIRTKSDRGGRFRERNLTFDWGLHWQTRLSWQPPSDVDRWWETPSPPSSDFVRIIRKKKNFWIISVQFMIISVEEKKAGRKKLFQL